MTFQVHSGVEGSDYNSYTDLEFADLYHRVRATAVWFEADKTAREASLVRATDYIDATYKFNCPAAENGAVHPLVKKATIILAANALTDSFTDKAEAAVIEEEKELAGVGKKRRKYDTKPVSDPYPMVTAVLAPITVRPSGSVQTGKIIK